MRVIENNDLLEQTNILVIDNERRYLEDMEGALIGLNCNVFAALNDKQAIDYSRNHDFSCILAGVDTPGIDNFEFLTLLKKQGNVLKVPIIFISSSQEDSHIIHGYNLGAIDYLVRPYNPEVLVAKVRNYISYYHANHQLRDLLGEQKKLLSELNSLAFYDPLTDLYNRRKFWDMAEILQKTAERYKEQFALLLLDLDGFKYINDTLGHDVGDALLVEVAKRMKITLRDSDLIGRMGGDEFAVILPKLIDFDCAANVAEKLKQALATPFPLVGHELYISVSIGIACFPLAGKKVKSLFKKADIALYRAKEKGKNAFHFYSEKLRLQYDRHFQMEHELKKALPLSEFYLEYQPCVHLETGKITGVEALIRWNSKKYGFVSPDEFIPLAEKSNVIDELSFWVLEQACKDYQIWKQYECDDFVLAINVSPHLFKNKQNLNQLVDVIASHKVRNDQITLELTESAIDGHFSDIEKSLTLLTEHKFNIAIDDFGTGYSSLARISKFPVNVMKIDKTFVQDIGVNKSSEAIINLTISLSHSLGFKVIAEGVETKEHALFLLANGCIFAQGFYYSRPVSAEKIAELLNTPQKSVGVNILK